VNTLIILIVSTLFLVAVGGTEAWLHRHRLRRIPIRIHVNGTRGKSSVTRLIAAGLRAGGIRTSAKTTGTLPRMIFPDGTELPIFRSGRPNIIEQKRIVALACADEVQALVVECMALQPPLQSLCERRFVRSTIGVITNARPDHLDVMGPDAQGVALALAGTTPIGGKLYTAEKEQLGVFQDAASDRGSSIEYISTDEEPVTEDELEAFRYHEHAENVALALRVCKDVGVERDVAIKGMQGSSPDPGAMTEHRIEFFGRKMVFFNAFAANDPVSTERLWRWTLERVPEAQTKIAIFYCRGDRADRSRQLAEAYANWPQAHWTILMGTGTHHFAKYATVTGVESKTLVYVEGLRVEEIFERVVELADEKAVVTGMGNVGGLGLDLARFFRNRGKLVER
jgi:poly-gamma-glutamate synthase PgsB/CapB